MSISPRRRRGPPEHARIAECCIQPVHRQYMQWHDHSLRKRAACSERESKRDKGAERPGRSCAAVPCPLDCSVSIRTSTATRSLIHSSCEAWQRAELLYGSSCRRAPSPSHRKRRRLRRCGAAAAPEAARRPPVGAHAARWCGPFRRTGGAASLRRRERRDGRPLDGETGPASFIRLGKYYCASVKALGFQTVVKSTQRLTTWFTHREGGTVQNNCNCTM